MTWMEGIMAINIGDTVSGNRSGLFYTELMNLYIQYKFRDAAYEGKTINTHIIITDIITSRSSADVEL